MKNFNNDEIEKAEKMGKKIFGTMPRISYSFNSKKILKGIGLLGIVYGLYTNYRCKSYEKKNYVDAFTLKKEVSSQVRMYDLWNKIMKFDFSSDKFATNRYYEILQEKLNKQAQKYRQSRKIKRQKQIKLTEWSKTKFDFYFFRLHKKESYIMIDRKGTAIKRSYYSPFILGSIPLRQKKRESQKRKGKRSVIQKYAKSKIRLQLQSECEKVNYYNIMNVERPKKLQQILQCKQKIKPLQGEFVNLLFKREQEIQEDYSFKVQVYEEKSEK